MRYLFALIIVSVIAVAIVITVDWNGTDLSLTIPSTANTTNNKESDKNKKPVPDYISEAQTQQKGDAVMRIDTVMYAKGHAFGYCGDVSMWGGWYLDTVFVGNDYILHYDSVGPSTLKLSLVTRDLVVDLGDKMAIDKIKNFMNPIDGFKRYRKRYEECLDSIYYEGYGYDEYMGGFTFEVDYPDSCNEIAEKINQFICNLTNLSESEKAKVPGLSAFYAGFNQTKCYRPAYNGNTNDMNCLSDFLAHKTFENWKRAGEYGMGSSEATLVIRPHIANEKYVTFSKYEYDRQGLGHGMYTETFHSYDMKKGKELSNKDIFKTQFLDKVKMRLFEVMAKDPHYLAWHGDEVSPADIEEMIEVWQSPDPILAGTEWEEPERDIKFELPDGALTNSGIVFSFQPYEIDCWAAGAYHFIVPYKKLMPYLTPEAKRLISN